MSAIVVIPARFDSVRFKGKPLALIGGKTMIRHVFERAKKAKNIKEVFVATDDDRISSEVISFGGNVCLTSKLHKSGTDRIAEAIIEIEKRGYLSSDEDIIINLQGDEPLIHPPLLEQLADVMAGSDMNMATFAKQIENDDDIANPNVVKVVFDLNNYALYFSRSPIPFQRNRHNIYKHIGIYGYKKSFLKRFTSLNSSPLELAEGLEQLRALEQGFKIKVLITDRDTIGVDIPEDIERVNKWIKNSSL